ncbi:MAG: hypothetical protein HFG46_05735 [Clostridium sp.]|jgi:hypothetical protein|nr:hypothetical protein [Clostridium sp.]
MKRKLVFCMLPALLLLALLGSAAFEPVRRNNRTLRRNMRALSGMEDGEKVHLGDLAAFEWSYVYTFDPYTTKEEMAQQMGVSPRHLQETVSEGMVQLIFVDDRGNVSASVCGYADRLGYSVDLGKWDEQKPYRRIARETDEFVYHRRRGGLAELAFEGQMFEGTVEAAEELSSLTALIRIDDGWDIRRSGETVSVRLTQEQARRIRKGDRVRVFYDGMVAETSPLQIPGQMRVEAAD